MKRTKEWFEQKLQSNAQGDYELQYVGEIEGKYYFTLMHKKSDDYETTCNGWPTYYICNPDDEDNIKQETGSAIFAFVHRNLVKQHTHKQ